MHPNPRVETHLFSNSAKSLDIDGLHPKSLDIDGLHPKSLGIDGLHPKLIN